MRTWLSTPRASSLSCASCNELTGDEHGAQRVAWTDTWNTARAWLAELLDGLPLERERDEAGNDWWTLRGRSDRAVLIGGHIDSVPNGGWLDGCLNVVAGAEVLRRIAEEGAPAVTVRLVNWADEEGARFGRSLFGSSAAAGSMTDQDALRRLTDRDGVGLPEALAANGVDLDQATAARRQLEHAAAYLELHIEQGPVLESLELPLGAVLGTFGVERWRITWTGQAAHAGSTPMDKRRDALAGAAKLALELREIAAAVGRRRRLHLRRRHLPPGHRHVGRRDGGAAPRSAPSRRGEPGRAAATGTGCRAGALPPRRSSKSPGSGSGASSRSCSTTR